VTNTTVRTGTRRTGQARTGQRRSGQAAGGQRRSGPAAGSQAAGGQATAGQVTAQPQQRARRPLRAVGSGTRTGATTAVAPDRRVGGPANRVAPAQPGRAAPAESSRPGSAQAGRAAQGQAPRTSARATAPAGTAGTASPVRTAQRQPGTARAGGGRDAAGAGRRPASRTPFILLVLGLLGGGLLCLGVINTTLSAASYKINALQESNAEASQHAQQLQQQVATEESPTAIEQRALRLGMRMQPVLDFIDLRNDRSYTSPATVTGAYAVPGYTP
jgi:hypothetical protein